jgi:hypothetical protein
MPEHTGSERDHPFVSHNDWPESPGDDRFRLTPEAGRERTARRRQAGQVASIWEATMLIRERLSVSRWRAVLILSTLVAASLLVSSPAEGEWLLVLVFAWCCVAMASWQWRPSARLASAVERLAKYAP